MAPKRATPSWCHFNEGDADEDGALCTRYSNPDRHGVKDPINGECIADANDVIEASDGRCYRKATLKKWYEFSKNTGMPTLPVTRQPFSDEDVAQLGLPRNDTARIALELEKLNEHFNTSFTLEDLSEDADFDTFSISIDDDTIENLKLIDFSVFPREICDVSFEECTFSDEIPSWIYTIQIDTLILDSCSHIPEWFQYIQFDVMHLRIQNMEFEHVPEWITRRSTLVGLEISNNLSMHEFPLAVCAMTQLQDLTIKGTNIRTIPNDIQNLPDHWSLDLRNNKIEHMPISLKVHDIDVSSNKLKTLPELYFDNPDSTISIDFENNDVRRIPDSYFSPNVTFNGKGNPNLIEHQIVEMHKNGKLNI